jgi:hypothetical protein
MVIMKQRLLTYVVTSEPSTMVVDGSIELNVRYI